MENFLKNSIKIGRQSRRIRKKPKRVLTRLWWKFGNFRLNSEIWKKILREKYLKKFGRNHAATKFCRKFENFVLKLGNVRNWENQVLKFGKKFGISKDG